MLSIWCSQPADGRVIRVFAVILVLLWLSIATLCLRVSHYYSQLPSGPNSNYAQYCLTWFLFVPLNLACSVFLAKSIYTHAERAPRLLLLSIWALGRVLICTTGLIIIIAFCIPTYYRDALAAKQDPHTPGMLATCFTFVVLPLLLGPENRDLIRHYLVNSEDWGIFSDVSDKELIIIRQHYAMAASLCTMKSFTPEKALELIKRHFECCTLKSTMGDEDGSDYKTHIQTLRATRRKAVFGAVDAFVSHSQHDDEQQKWRWLKQWAVAYHTEHDRWPSIWYDRACIDEKTPDVQASLAALPLIVIGCQRLIVLAGPTYTSRLWALIEMITFMWSQEGNKEMLEIIPLLKKYGDREEEQALLKTLEETDVSVAECAYEEDRQLMLGVIESTYGTVDSLNKKLQRLLADRTIIMIQDVSSRTRIHQLELAAKAEAKRTNALKKGYARLRGWASLVDEQLRDCRTKAVDPVASFATPEFFIENHAAFGRDITQKPLLSLRKYEARMSDALFEVKKAVRDKEIEAEEEKLCDVCMRDAKDTALNCGHRFCGRCAADLTACAICRTEIKARIKLF